MENTLISQQSSRIAAPVIALTLYAIASGYLMSLIPLMLNEYNIHETLASWLASAFYAGLLIGAIGAERLVCRLGHKLGYIVCLVIFISTIIVLPLFANEMVWLMARFIAGVAVAGIFVVVESWLMAGAEHTRAKRLSVYMIALYGGSALGQFGIGLMGVSGSAPFIAISMLISAAIGVLMLVKSEQPDSQESIRLSFKQIMKLSYAAIIGCIVSGLTLGAIYGLMPVELDNRGISHDKIGMLMALVILGGMAVQPVVTFTSKWLSRTLLMAFYCLIGVFAIGLTFVSSSHSVLALALFGLGMATFALYPIAISLGCEKLDESYIVSAAQVMLLSYSIGSVLGPVASATFMAQQHGLLGYLFATLVATSAYMLLASVKSKSQIMAE
ncbi:MFS transporter [Motilimonas cestriensis]|uniref:MFS transporter n=1 Tax=Motilimonas cestriensis TaxID=2742685 RepID=A0ABS8WBQ3_9GAMM|nr:MFS transporter [Motilimonas cestriensis]MCE2595963.1 MFS transporter [Motilimonas cestriensis]